MEINEQTQGAVAVLRPRGPLCAGDADQFKARAHSVIGKSLGRFILDASEIAYVDSRGLEVLKETTQAMSQSGRTLRICGANETVREVLDLTGLADMFEHYTDVGSAVRSFL